MVRRLAPQRLAIWLCALGMGAAVLFDGLASYRSHRDARSQQEALVRATSRALAEQMAEILRFVDGGLTATSGLAAAIGWDGPESRQTLHQFLVDWQIRSPSTTAFWVTDMDGHLRVTSSFADPPPVDLSDRAAVRRQLDGAGGFVIGDQVRGRFHLSHDRPIVNVTRPITDEAGALRGVVGASLAVDYFVGMHHTIALAEGAVISVVAPQGTFISRVPWEEEWSPFTLAGHPLVTEWLPTTERGVVEMEYLTDGVTRLAAFERIDPYGVGVLVGIDIDHVYAAWRRELVWTGGGLGLVLLLLGGLTAGTVRSYDRWQRGIRAQEERQRAMARISEGLIAATDEDELFARLTTGLQEVLPGTRADVVDGGQPPPAEAPQALGDVFTIDLHGHDHRPAGRLRVSRADGAPWTVEHHAVAEQVARVAMTTLRKLDLSEARRVALEASEHTRRQLDASHERIDAVFRSISDAVYSLDREWRFTFLTPRAEELLRMQPGELLGRNIWEAFPGATETALRPALEAASSSGKEGSVDFFYPPFATWFEVRIFPNDDGLTVYFRDVTDRVRADAELRQAQKMDAIGQLTGGVAHDFNNLLTVILGNLEMLADAPGLEETDRRAVELAVKASEQAAQLTAQLLAFARRQPLAPRAVDVRQLVHEWDAVLARTLGPGIAVETSFADHLPAAQVDPVRLKNALLNLALNARDAMAGQGRLEVHVDTAILDDAFCREQAPGVVPGRYLRIDVSDNGSGMTPEVRDRAFDPFFTTKGAGRGSGLGLAMVYGFARQSGGHVGLRTVPGEGTTVTLYLPISTEAVAADHEAPATDDALVGGNEQVLLVEDEPAVADWLQRALVQLGYKVTIAGDAASALASLHREPKIDLLLTDIGLPGGVDGVTLAKAALRERPTIRVLFASGNAAAALADGANLPAEAQFVQKPIHFSDLAGAVRRALDRAQAQPR